LADEVNSIAVGTAPAMGVASWSAQDGSTRSRPVSSVQISRTRVRRLPTEGHPVTLDAHRSGHGADRQALPFQHRPLLDMRFQVSAGTADLLPRLVQAIEVDTMLGDHVTEPQTTGIGELADFGHVQRSRHGGGAEQAVPKSGALFIGPFHQRERARQRPTRRQAAENLHRTHDAIRAIEPTAVRDRVQVGADDHNPIAGAGQPRPLVARGIGPDGHREPLQLLTQERARPLPDTGPGNPLGARRVAGQLRQGAQHRHDTDPIWAGIRGMTRTRHCQSFSRTAPMQTARARTAEVARSHPGAGIRL